MSEAKNANRAEKIVRKLGDLERRRRRLCVLRGAGLWLAVVLPAAALFCFVDWLQHMPLVARWAGLAGLCALAWWSLRRLVLPALRSRRDLDQSARSVDRFFPASADGVITAVQLDRRWEDFGYGSEELRVAAQAQALEFSSSVSFSHAEPLSRYAGPLLLGASALLLAGAATATFPRIVGIWAVRCFWKADYPHKTRIEEYDRTVRVARGETAVVNVRGGGILPSRGVLRIRSKLSGWSARELLPVEGGARGAYRARVEEVVEPLEFRVELNDAPPAAGRIEVVDRPGVASVEVRTDYPKYTGMSAESFMSGHVRAVPGSKVRLTVVPSKPLKAAGLTFSDGGRVHSGEDKALQAGSKGMASGAQLSLEEGGLRVVARFSVRESGSYSLNMTDTMGFENSSDLVSPVSYKISAVPDSPPRVTLVKPGGEALATPVSIVKLVYRISDDYGVRRARLAFRRNSDKEWKSFPVPLPGLDPKKPEADLPIPGPRRADQALLWDISTLGFKVGDMITYRLEAEDHLKRQEPEPGTSGEQFIRVVSQEVVIKKLREDLEITAKQLQNVFNLEKDSHERVRKLLEEIRKLKGK